MGIRSRRRVVWACLACVLVGGIAWAAWAEAPAAGSLAISNEFIRIRVNPGPGEAGRFAVDTTGGDPSRSADDNKVLIYGSREPWTSFTTVLVDGEPAIFGGPTSRRAGKDVAVGSVTRGPQVSEGMIVCAVRVGDIEVTQELGFARSPTTRVRDAARIAYSITNRGQTTHSVGLRVVLDTMLGSNDGAPLRAGAEAITTATRLVGEGIPDYWQAFDSLSEPAVISQGTLRGTGMEPPARLEMVDWGTLADAPWEFPFPVGAGFTRRGEAEQDTAAAVYWEAVPLAPGQTRQCVTLYGVGGVSLSPAQLSLGLTAPAEVDFRYEEGRAFAVVAYVENSGGFESRGTMCTLELPKGLKLEQGDAGVKLGLLKPGETRQASWRVLPTGEATGSLMIAARAMSENLEPNRVEREVTVNSPPQLVLSLAAPERLTVTPANRYSPNPFGVELTVKNAGAQTARNVVVTLGLADGLDPVDGESMTQVGERLGPGEETRFRWQARATGLPTGGLAISVKASAAGARPLEAKRTVQVPWLTPELRVYPSDQTVPARTDGQPTLVPIAVKLAPAREFAGARVSLSYDPAVLEPLYVSRGEGFVEAGRLLSPWSGGVTGVGQIAGMGGMRGEAPVLNVPEVTLLTVVFMVRGPGETAVTLEPTVLVNGEAREVEHRAVGGRVKVRALEETR